MTIFITDRIVYRVTGMGSLDALDSIFAAIIAEANGQSADDFIRERTGKAYQLHFKTYAIKREVEPPRHP